MKRNREQIISNPQRGDVIRHPTFVGGATLTIKRRFIRKGSDMVTMHISHTKSPVGRPTRIVLVSTWQDLARGARFNLLRPDTAIDAHAQGQAGEEKDG